MTNKIKQTGVTLIELTVVLLILIALAGITLPYVSGTSSSGLCNATDITMQNTKKAVMEGFYIDTLGNFPADKGSTNYNLTYLFEKGSWEPYDPSSRIGWKGPYLTAGRILDDTNFPSSGGFTSPTYVNDVLIKDTHFAVFDAWNRPLIIQENAINGFRLLSAGENGILETKRSDPTIPVDASTGAKKNDDRIIYLDKPAPESNDSCS